MTAFPTTHSIISSSFKVTPEDGSEVSESDDGATRIRRLYGQSHYRIEFELFKVRPAEKAVLDQFYADNKNVDVTWIDPFTSTSYSVKMLQPPRVTEYYGGGACSVEFKLRGVAQ